jgi:hypothetical protein
MAQTPPLKPKKQITLDQYLKLIEKRAASKLKLHFPLFIKLAAVIPTAYLLFVILYFLFHARFLPEH